MCPLIIDKREHLKSNCHWPCDLGPLSCGECKMNQDIHHGGLEKWGQIDLLSEN